MSTTTFFKNFIKTPSSIGAVCPTSSYLSKEMTREIGLEKAESVVELGPGTGAITPHIVDALNPATKFFAVELNTEFYNYFRNKYPELTIYHEDASNLKHILKKEELDGIDAVISALPWTTLPVEVQDKLLTAIVDALNPGCYFTTISYVTGRFTTSGKKFNSKLKEYFSHVGLSKMEWRNIPPSFVYRCKK